MMTDYDLQNLPEILAGQGTWFTAKLLRLISCADSNNRHKLHKSYPEEVEAVNLYQHGTRENYGQNYAGN